MIMCCQSRTRAMEKRESPEAGEVTVIGTGRWTSGLRAAKPHFPRPKVS